MSFGIFCLLPIVVIIVMAIITKRGIASLVTGVIISYIMLYGIKFFWPLIDGVYAAMMDEDTVWILLVCAFLGSFTVLLEKSGGVKGLANVLMKWAKSPKRSLIASWIAGIIIFMDDYLNIFVVGALMKKVTDKNKVPREMLAYVVDSTAAPVCLLIPLSSWAVFFSVVIGEQEELAGLGSGMDIYVHSIPFIFYAWLAVIVVPLAAIGIIPKFGPMKKAFNRTESTGMVFSEESAKLAVNKEDVQDGQNGNMWMFILPVIVLIVITVWQDDILIGLIASNALLMLMMFVTKISGFGDLCDHLINGFAGAMPLIAICAISVFARGAFTELEIADYIISVAADFLSPAIFPALTFVIVAALAFVTVSCWGMVAVAVPIIIPLAIAVGADPYLVVGAILAGSGFGSHACPFEDASVMTSQVTGISPIEHFATQFPYAMISAVGSVILFLVFGIVM